MGGNEGHSERYFAKVVTEALDDKFQQDESTYKIKPRIFIYMFVCPMIDLRNWTVSKGDFWFHKITSIFTAGRISTRCDDNKTGVWGGHDSILIKYRQEKAYNNYCIRICKKGTNKIF